MRKYGIIAVVVIVLSLIILPSLKCFKQVDAGFRGIKLVWGKVASDSLPEGLYFFNPISTNIVAMDTRLQRKTTKLETYTKDIQQANIYLTVNFYVDPVNAGCEDARITYRSEKPLGAVITGSEELKSWKKYKS